MERRKEQHQSAGRHGDAFWTEEANNFGVKMMKGMGWEKGKGLGKSEAGQTTFLRATKKENTLGIGAVAGRDEVWSATQGMYNDLLSRLAAAAQTGDVAAESPADEQDKDMTASASASLKKYMAKQSLYGKFKRAKDASNYDAKSMGEIFGRKPSSSPEPLPSSSPTNRSTTSAYSSGSSSDSPLANGRSSIPTVNSSVSIKDYFANKLAQGKKGPNGSPTNGDAPKAPSRFQVASGTGFSEGFQASYYEEQMNRSISGKGGLGFGGGQVDEDEEHKRDDGEDFYTKAKREREAKRLAEEKEAKSGKDSSSDEEKADNVDDEAEKKKQRKKEKKDRKRKEQEEKEAAEKAAKDVAEQESKTEKKEDESTRKQRKADKKERRRKDIEEKEAAEKLKAEEEAAAAAKEDKKKKKKEKKRKGDNDDEELATTTPVEKVEEEESPKEKKKRKKASAE